MRSYGQFCGLAFGLDIIGDRWNLLIVRNLILGPQRWKELRFNLPGVAKNLLSKRLKELEDTGVIIAENETYALTEKGRELEPIIFALARWGRKYFVPDDTTHQKRRRFLYTSLRGKIETSEKESKVLLRIDEDILIVTLGPKPTLIQTHEEQICDVEFRTDFLTFFALIFDEGEWKSFEADGKVNILGSRRVVNELMKVMRF